MLRDASWKVGLVFRICLSRKKWLETTGMGLGVEGRGKPIFDEGVFPTCGLIEG